MDSVSTFRYSGHAPVVSGSGYYLAYVSGTRLAIKNTVDLATKKLVDLGNDFARNVKTLKWDPYTDHESGEDRIAVATSNEARTFCVDQSDEQTSSSIHVGPNAIAGIDWISCTASQCTRLAVFSRDMLTVDLWSSDGVDLSFMDPKYTRILPMSTSLLSSSSSYSIVCRHGTLDTVHCVSYSPQGVPQHKAIPLTGILDAKSVSWSSDGKWLAALDTFATGYNIQLWRGYGRLVRTYKGPYNDIYREAGLGARSMAWLSSCSSSSSRNLLLIGDCQNQVTVLDADVLQPITLLLHGSVYDKTSVWEEYMTKDLVSCYRVCINPWYPPELKHESKAFVSGISSIHVSPNNRFIATRSSNYPSVAWIWSAGSSSSDYELLSVINQPAPITRLEWQPEEGRYLLIMSKGGTSTGIWDSATQEPALQEWDELNGSELLGGSWVTFKSEDMFITKLLAWTSHDFSLREVAERPIGEPATRVESPQLPQDDDTLVRDLANGVQENEWIQGASLIEDTFQQKLVIGKNA